MSAFLLNPELNIEEDDRVLHARRSRSYLPHRIRHPPLYVVSFLPQHTELLILVGFFMEFRPIFCYIQSDHFFEEYARCPSLQKTPLQFHIDSVRKEFTLRWKNVISYGYKHLEFRKELAQLLFFLTRVQRPNYHYELMLELVTHPESKFYDQNFSRHAKPCLDLKKMNKLYPGFLRYRFFHFEQDPISSTSLQQ